MKTISKIVLASFFIMLSYCLQSCSDNVDVPQAAKEVQLDEMTGLWGTDHILFRFNRGIYEYYEFSNYGIEEYYEVGTYSQKGFKVKFKRDNGKTRIPNNGDCVVYRDLSRENASFSFVIEPIGEFSRTF